MRKAIFKKAAEIVKRNRLKKDSETDYAIFYKVVSTDNQEIHNTSFFYKNSVLSHNCECKHMVYGEPTNLCKHKLAMIYSAVKEELDETNK